MSRPSPSEEAARQAQILDFLRQKGPTQCPSREAFGASGYHPAHRLLAEHLAPGAGEMIIQHKAKLSTPRPEGEGSE